MNVGNFPRTGLGLGLGLGLDVVGVLSSFFNDPKTRTLINIVFCVTVATKVTKFASQVRIYGLKHVVKSFGEITAGRIVKILKFVPGASTRIDAEKTKLLNEMEEAVFKDQQFGKAYPKLLPTGLNPDEIRTELIRYNEMSQFTLEDGKISGAIYHGGKELNDLICEAFKIFTFTNPLHPDLFPGIRKMESEIVSMVVHMFNGDSQACGTLTSGGTESILMACKAYRDYALDKRGITEPEMVIPVTAHAAFDKAGQYFNIKVHHAPLDPETYEPDLNSMRRLINSNTIMLVASAPCFPYGVMDPVDKIAALAKSHNIFCHVDACLGGFLIAFMDLAGFPLKPFDFRVEGVTSISCDTHKYGFAPKGSSVLLYNNQEVRRYQYFVAPDWPGGIYASPTSAGSRPGALVAGCWVAMMSHGLNGYVESTRAIVETTRKIEAGVRKIEGLYIMGKPEVSVVALSSKKFDIYHVGASLSKRGWNINSMQFPPCLHICVTRLHTFGSADVFLSDLSAAVAKVMSEPPQKAEGIGAIYGLAATIPDRGLVDEFARSYVDLLYKVKESH